MSRADVTARVTIQRNAPPGEPLRDVDGGTGVLAGLDRRDPPARPPAQTAGSADRLRKYLARFGLTLDQIAE